MLIRAQNGTIFNLNELEQIAMVRGKKGHIVRATTATFHLSVDLTHPVEQEVAQEIMDRIMTLTEGNLDLLSRERYWGDSDDGSDDGDVELEDQDTEGRSPEAGAAKK